MKPITYTSEHPSDYSDGLAACQSLKELRQFLKEWQLLAYDALEIAERMKAKDWPVFKAGLDKERRGKFAGEEFAEKYGAILLPLAMFKVSMIAHQFMAPWGCAYIRCKEQGMIDVRDNVAHWVEKQ